MKHIVSFSTGLSSALTVERVYSRYGADDMVVVFMDTTIEDTDNYRFRDNMYARWHNMDICTIELKEGRDPYRVARDKHIIPSSMLAPCTHKLKIEPFRKWLIDLGGDRTVHIGFDYSEVHRCAPSEKKYADIGCEVDFPLLWRPLEFRPYPEVCKNDWGIEPPRMYEMGYTHANCGGVCVKQGFGDWKRTLINFPDRYAAAEAWEQMMREPGSSRENFAILKDRSNDDYRPLTLKEFRERYENDDADQLSLFDSLSACVHCGIGDM